MSKTDKTDKTNNDLLGNNEGVELSDTSFITNIKIDVSASPNRPSSREKGFSASEKPSNENNFLKDTNVGAYRPSTRTTTLALDPRPYKKREQVYTTIIIILAIALAAQSGLLWMMHLYSARQNNNNQTSKPLKQEQIIISGANLNQEKLEKVAEALMRKYVGKAVIISPKNERLALAEFAQGQVQVIQMTEQLSTEEKKQLGAILGKSVEEIYIQTSALGIYVNETDLINELSLSQLQEIYTGRIFNWKTLTGEDVPITTYKFNDNRFIDRLFQQKVTKESKPESKVSLNKLVELNSDFKAKSLVIGYGEINSSLPSKTKLIKLKLSESDEGFFPIIEGKVNQQYPLIYNTYWYAVGLPEDVLKVLVEEIQK